jgi:hypothetical protein
VSELADRPSSALTIGFYKICPFSLPTNATIMMLREGWLFSILFTIASALPYGDILVKRQAGIPPIPKWKRG